MLILEIGQRLLLLLAQLLELRLLGLQAVAELVEFLRAAADRLDSRKLRALQIAVIRPHPADCLGVVDVEQLLRRALPSPHLRRADLEPHPQAAPTPPGPL